MLCELRVENLLLIERAELRLGPGLNVLTGETGAGKTVLAHALDLLLGGKARAGIVRPGASEAYVEGVFELPDALRGEQRSFDKTGGLHAAGLFTADGEQLVVREDVGRHNAVDKVVGWALQSDRVPGVGCVLVVSGRASVELTQKAIMAGIPCLAAVSAPSSLAVECAEDAGMSLLGFVRGSRLNVYAGAHRITTS